MPHIVLSEPTFDRFDRAAKKADGPGIRGQTNGNFQSPIVQFLQVVAGSTNSNGYPAYVQGTTDGGLTWGNIGNSVRVRHADGTALAEDDYVHARFAGMNAGGEACFIVVGVPASGGSSLESIIFQLTANDTYTTTNTYEELTGFNATALGSLTYVEFPSTGYWLCEAHAFCYTEFSSIGLTDGFYDQYAEIWMRIKPVSGDSALIFPEDTGTEIHGFLNAQLPNYLKPPAGNNDTDACYGAGSISFILRVDTANTKALEWHTINKIVGGPSPANRSTTIYYTRNVGTGSTARPTYIRATKVGEL